jgi:hypothetical protein
MIHVELLLRVYWTWKEIRLIVTKESVELSNELCFEEEDYPVNLSDAQRKATPFDILGKTNHRSL